jgi:Na+/melibiose symporter-like transporter
VAYVLGPSIAGYLVQALTAPVALLADAVSFAWSAAWIAVIRGREPAPTSRRREHSLRHEIGDGLRLVFGHPVLRALVLFNATTVLFWSLERAIEVVFLVRTVHLSATGIGVLFGIASCGSVVAAFVAVRLARRYGQARIMLGAAAVGNTLVLLVPMTALGPRLALFAIGFAVSSFCVVVFNIVSLTFRQTLCPEHLLGRMNATMRFFSWGTLPVGALLGGALGTAIGLRPTLWLGAAGGVLSLLWLLRSPLPRTHDHVDGAAPADDPAHPPPTRQASEASQTRRPAEERTG